MQQQESPMLQPNSDENKDPQNQDSNLQTLIQNFLQIIEKMAKKLMRNDQEPITKLEKLVILPHHSKIYLQNSEEILKTQIQKFQFVMISSIQFQRRFSKRQLNRETFQNALNYLFNLVQQFIFLSKIFIVEPVDQKIIRFYKKDTEETYSINLKNSLILFLQMFFGIIPQQLYNYNSISNGWQKWNGNQHLINIFTSIIKEGLILKLNHINEVKDDGKHIILYQKVKNVANNQKVEQLSQLNINATYFYKKFKYLIWLPISPIQFKQFFRIPSNQYNYCCKSIFCSFPQIFVLNLLQPNFNNDACYIVKQLLKLNQKNQLNKQGFFLDAFVAIHESFLKKLQFKNMWMMYEIISNKLSYCLNSSFFHQKQNLFMHYELNLNADDKPSLQREFNFFVTLLICSEYQIKINVYINTERYQNLNYYKSIIARLKKLSYPQLRNIFENYITYCIEMQRSNLTMSEYLHKFVWKKIDM